jgi:hypothetical protein
MRNLAALLCLFLLGCGPMPDKPKNVLEQIEAAEITAQQVEASIVALTCTKFHVKQCVEPGKALDPKTSLELLATVENGRDGLKAAIGLGPDKIGLCLGQQRDQLACLNAARSIILQIETMLLRAKEGKP